MARHCAGRLDAQKKSLSASEQDAGQRAAWRLALGALDPTDFVFVDETSTNRALTRRYARAPRGERAEGRAPRNHGPNVTLLAALTPDGIGPALVVEGAVDGAAFELYVERLLAPSLRPGQVVVLDNLSAHTGERVRDLVAAAGGRVLFLPAYSPDFNPIEQAFAKIKQALRRAGARTFEALSAAIGAAIDAVSAADARGFYAHCGFPLP